MHREPDWWSLYGLVLVGMLALVAVHFVAALYRERRFVDVGLIALMGLSFVRWTSANRGPLLSPAGGDGAAGAGADGEPHTLWVDEAGRAWSVSGAADGAAAVEPHPLPHSSASRSR